MSAKHEKVLIGKGRLGVIKKAITELSKEEKQFRVAMKSLPPIQKLPAHYYLYVPIEFSIRLKEKFEDIHLEKYGYID